jgi:competence protein ComEA
MMERSRRLVLWTAMAASALILFISGHGSFSVKRSVAFLFQRSSHVTVRISGNLVNPGVYTFPCGTNIKTVIKMTAPDLKIKKTGDGISERVLRDGDVVEFADRGVHLVDITVKTMKVREMVVLGIPLDPNVLGADEWESLPGIGPALALCIIHDRQENGDYRSFRDLERVPGIGKKKIKQLAQFF